MIVAVLLIAAAVVALVPFGIGAKRPPPSFALPGAAPVSPTAPVVAAPGGGGFQAAVGALSVVRGRVNKTGHLTPETKAAIDVLTLALVAGSETE